MQLSTKQKAFLNDLIGHYVSVIINYPELDSGTKILYLERAITQNSIQFLRSLDLLYQPIEQPSSLVIIHALKLINDLYYDNPITQRVNALWYYLRLRNRSDEQPSYQTMLETIIDEAINCLCCDDPDTIVGQKKLRKANESSLIRNSRWRYVLELPKAQLAASFIQDNLPAAENSSDLNSVMTQAYLNKPIQLTRQYSTALVSFVIHSQDNHWSFAEIMKKLDGLGKDQLLLAAKSVAQSKRIYTGLGKAVLSGPEAITVKHFLADGRALNSFDAIQQAQRLNNEQIIAIRHFKLLGYADINLIIDWKENVEFNADHRMALISLTTNLHQRIKLDEAIDAIRGLKGEQLLAVELIAQRFGALPELGTALRTWDHGVLFNWWHKKALLNLLFLYYENKKEHLCMHRAIAEIKSLTIKQLKIIESVSCSLIDMDSIFGLGDALRTHGDVHFDKNHVDALVYLMNNAEVLKDSGNSYKLVEQVMGMSSEDALDLVQEQRRSLSPLP